MAQNGKINIISKRETSPIKYEEKILLLDFYTKYFV
jgi:hypothetical protein